MLVLGIALIIVSALALVGMFMDDVDNEGVFLRVIFGSITALLGVAMIIPSSEEPTPKALDVYRGNTELQIESKLVNGEVVSTDSIVVWKK